MNLLRAAATISGLTLVSRILGLVRETLVASVYGAGALTDAFFVAFRLPNMLRRLFAEGAFTQAPHTCNPSTLGARGRRIAYA